MPLYRHKITGERKRTVPGKYEDRRVATDPNWELIPPAASDTGDTADGDTAAGGGRRKG